MSVPSEASIAVSSIPACIPRAGMVSIPALSTGQGLALSALPLSVQDLHAFLCACHQEAQGAACWFLHGLLDPSNSFYLNLPVSPCPCLLQPLDLLPSLFWFLFSPVPTSLFRLEPHTVSCPNSPIRPPHLFIKRFYYILFMYCICVCMHTHKHNQWGV